MKKTMQTFFCAMSTFLMQADEYERIAGSHREEVIPFLEQFPLDEYKIYRVEELGDFYLDAKPDHIKNKLRTGQPWEPQIQKIIAKYALADTTVLDIGAHIGTHALMMAKQSGQVLAFEPQPKIFRELFWNMRLNSADNIVFYPVAVGDHEGSIELAPLLSGNEGGTSLLKGGTGKFVPLITIDSLNLTNVSLMKIDVELMENYVLDGAKETILRNKPVILIEILKNYSLLTAPEKKKNQILFTISKLENWGYKVEPIGGADYLALPQ